MSFFELSQSMSEAEKCSDGLLLICRKFLAKALYVLLESVLLILWRRNDGDLIGSLPDGPQILVCNHGSYLDWGLLDVLLSRKYQRSVTFLAKGKLLANPIWRQMVWYRRSIVVDEHEKIHATSQVIRLFRKRRNENPIVVIFPEGTRSRSGERLPSHAGAAWLARRCNVELVPVALRGFWQVWPPHKRLPSLKRGRLCVQFLAPVNLTAINDDVAATTVAMDRIYACINSPDQPQRLVSTPISINP